MPKSKSRGKRYNPFKRLKALRQKNVEKQVKQRFLREVMDTEGYQDLDDQQKALLHDTVAFKQMVESFDTIVEKFLSSFGKAKEKYNCRQLQYMMQDMQSIRDHVKSLEDYGPMPADEEVPLEESELGDDEGGNKPFVATGGLPSELPKEMIEDAQEAMREENNAQD